MSTAEMERRLTTIVAADVVGYSRLMAEDEAGTLRRLTQTISNVFEPLAERHKGRIVKRMGDGLLLEFASVVEAVSFAVAVQEALRDTPQAPLAFRVGVNIGDVIVSDGDIFGDGVNVAARIEALAEPGEVLVSKTVSDHVRGKSDFAFQDRGVHQVKNIPEPVSVFRVTREPVSQMPPGPKNQTTRRGLVGLCVAGGLAIALALGGWFWQSQQAVRVTEPARADMLSFPLPDVPSIAVMPFRDSGDSETADLFADGLTEDLITDLSKISGLFVIARDSSFAFKDKEVSITALAEALGVRYVLDGNVRLSGNTLRLNTQLVDTTTGRAVWADRFDGVADDVFTVQDRFVLRIVQALELTLSDQERDEIAKVDTRQLEAREAFQQGWALYSRFNRDDNAASVPYFLKAVELDPEYGRAWGALALVHLRGAVFHDWDLPMGKSDAVLYYDVPEFLRLAETHETSLVHVVRALLHLNYRDSETPEGRNRGNDDARIEAAAAIAAQPSDPEAHVMMAWALIAGGRPDEGLKFLRAATRLNPNYPSHYVLVDAAAQIGRDDLDSAADVLLAGLEREQTAQELAPMAASVLARLGRREEATALLTRWRGENAEQAIEGYFFALRWVGDQSDRNLAMLDGLRLAALPLSDTVESLTASFADPDAEARHLSLRKIGWFGEKAAPAVPLLRNALQEPSRLVQREAVIALGKIGFAAKPALPDLRARVEEPLIGFHARRAIAAIEQP